MGIVYHSVKKKERARGIPASFLINLLLFLRLHQGNVKFIQLGLRDFTGGVHFPKRTGPFWEP